MTRSTVRRSVTILINGRSVTAAEGQTAAAALAAKDILVLRRTYRNDKPRGMFCGIGICFDCVMTIDGRAGIRACLEPVREGMRIDLPEDNP